jgi:acetolactate synthase I/II/III large subunit
MVVYAASSRDVDTVIVDGTFGTAQGEIRWDLVAQGLGCHGEYVERIEDLDGALRRSREHDGPALVCVRTDHDANLAIPAEMTARVFEVYSGPATPAAV